MDSYPFLSPEWIAAAQAIRSEFAGQLPAPDTPLRANVIIKNAPFDDSQVKGYVDTSDGAIMLEVGQLTDPELTVSTDYETAKTLFVGKDGSKIMEAFMKGKILVTGDVGRILSLAPSGSGNRSEIADEVSRRLAAITAE